MPHLFVFADSEDFFFRQLRSPFERKLKGTRRGCSAYGHSCFGGYGKRAGGAAMVLALPLPPLPQAAPLPQPQPQPRERDRDSEPEQEVGDAAFLVLRPSPVSSRAPLWGRPAAAAAGMKTLHGGDLDTDGTAAAAERGAGVDSGEDGDGGPDRDPNLGSVAGRLFLRRWVGRGRRYSNPGSDAPNSLVLSSAAAAGVPAADIGPRAPVADGARGSAASAASEAPATADTRVAYYYFLDRERC
ncbi:hypothetical protein ONE63_003997 [Megalurothrips usitatus]|uniref:Uncharacterized protein n=1 Tax=Megalurothrips usitatus TaxID=439358 RepID=A0AAV7X8Q0_9NEOP|nr:hypothetical protein ONE63_003997 [Megalurothrips usitatus]